MPLTPTHKKDVFVVQVQDNPDLYEEDELDKDGQGPWEDRDDYPTMEAAQENIAYREGRLRQEWDRRHNGPLVRRITVQLRRENLEAELQRVRDRHARHFPTDEGDEYKRPEYPKYRIVRRTFVEEEVVTSQ